MNYGTGYTLLAASNSQSMPFAACSDELPHVRYCTHVHREHSLDSRCNIVARCMHRINNTA